jgi:hypothetical protein
MRAPDVPKAWRALVSATRPRDIYLPRAASLAYVGEGIFTLVPLVHVLLRRAQGSLLISFHADKTEIFWIVAYVVASILHVAGLLRTREIVRDGELTVAYVVADPTSATYQFCTTTGDWFEGRSRIVSRDALKQASVTPVFYMPEDPRRNVALFGTPFRVRLPEDGNARALHNMPAKT